MVVKGKTEPVGVYELLDYHTEDSFPNMINTLAAFRDGMENYLAGKWEEGRKSFSQALAENPLDECSQVYIDRCDYLLKNADPEQWDGIWVMTSK